MPMTLRGPIFATATPPATTTSAATTRITFRIIVLKGICAFMITPRYHFPMTNMPMHFAAPPRGVPPSLRVVNFFNGAAQLGWAVFGFGMIFFWGFGMNADFSFATFHVDGQTRGRVTAVEDTHASENKRSVAANHYQY